MAKSKYEKQHEADLVIISEQLAKARKDYDLCEDGFREVIEEINNLVSKALDVDTSSRRGGTITLEMDVDHVGVNHLGDMLEDQAHVLEDILHTAVVNYFANVGASLNSTNLSADLWMNP